MEKEKNDNQPRMTCASWIMLAGFGVLGVFAFWMIGFMHTVQDNRAEQVQAIFDLLRDDNATEAFDEIASDWQITLENADGLARTFADITVTDISFRGRVGSCYTNPATRNGEYVPTSDSVLYRYLYGNAKINGEDSEI